ncbi:AEC family transporter [Salipiger pallidus]|nr:AEC family transporter [Salipiger pallidus]
MQALIDIILPVFLVIGAGYLASWRGLLKDNAVDGLMGFTQTIAIPCLLFRGIWQLDLGQHFEPALLISFYTGALLSFAAGMIGARVLFRRDWEDSVVIAFACLFSNSLLLGLPITERAYGEDALAGNYAIIAMHSPFLYAVGITSMEIARAHGNDLRKVPLTIVKAMARNALVIGISIGLVFNLAGVTLPDPALQALDMVTRTAIPAALFALGGVLWRYRPEGDMLTVLFVCAMSLGVHPGVMYLMGQGFGLGTDALRSGTITAAMAPGVNAYVFANLYGRAKRVAATSVLLATGLCLLSSWVWLQILP